MFGAWSIALLVLFGLAVFAALGLFLWHIVGKLISSLGGWQNLSSLYSTNEVMPTHVLHKQTLQVGSTIYNRCVDVGFSEDALFLKRTDIVAGSQSKPLRIAWTDIKAVNPTKLHWKNAIEMTLRDPQNTKITMYSELFEAMRPSLPQKMQLPA